MRKTFLKWLLVFVLAAFFLAVLISYIVQTSMATASADELVDQRISDVESRIDDYLDRSDRTLQVVDGLLLDKVHAIALLVASNPQAIFEDGYLEGLADELGVDEVVVTDATGIVTASYPEENTGYNMADSAQSGAFLDAITEPDFALVQEFQTKGLGTDDVKYAGVARIDEPGIVQVGYCRERMNEVMGVVDVSQVLGNVTIGQNGMLFLLQDATVISATDPSAIGKSAAELGLAQDGRHAEVNGESCRVATAEYRGYTVAAALPDAEVYLNRNSSLQSMVIFNFGIFLVVFVLVSMLVQKVVISGIFRVNDSLGKITAGNLEERVEVRDSPEFGALSDGINATVGALKSHIATEASRIDDDLALARAIQLGNLRTDFPVFPERDEFRVFAHMVPAREVGGDFYDMFMPDGRHVAVVVADVSGKGIPAAMFMMEAKSCISAIAEGNLDLADVFTQVNERLCANNGLNLFVTAFMACLDVETGEFTYVNAGHNPPCVLEGAGSLRALPTKPGFVLGGMEGMRYHMQTGQLLPGDALLLYTDGVTEAQNEAGEFYGEGRMEALLARVRSETPQGIVRSLEQDIAAFRGQAEQADDITVLALRYHGPGGANIAVAASVENLDRVCDFLDERLEAKGFSPKARNQVRLAAEEIFVNIAHYAYAQLDASEGEGERAAAAEGAAAEEGMAVVAIRFEDGDQEAVIDFYDAGVAYDPLQAGDPDITLSAEEREIGGLGIYLTKQLMDGVAYLHEKGKNHLTLRKRK